MSARRRGRLRPAEDLKFEPYWWRERDRSPTPEPDLPERVDVAIVGGGYTGLSAALTLARAGASVAVFDTEDPGDGASSRNGGMFGDRLKPGFGGLARRFGTARAVAMLDEASASVEFIERLAIDNGIACDFARMGRFYPAVTRAHYDSMAAGLEAEKAARPVQAEMVPADEQSQFIGSRFYAGGRLHHDTGGLHPAKFHDGLLAAARAAGALVAGRTAVLGLEETDNDIVLETSLGFVAAEKVLICTNGYTGPLTPEHQARVIPVTSAIVATDELDPDLVRRLIPGGRMIADSFNLLNYYRPSPDGRRILLGSRPGVGVGGDRKLAAHLGRRLGEIFPELDGVSLTHCWWGKVAFSFDGLPKIGLDGRIGHAMCYAGSGVAMSNWMGHKLAQKALGDLAGRSAFDDVGFPERFFYGGRPWFLGPAMAWYGFRDSLSRLRHGR